MPARPHTVAFEYERDTKNKVRYSEVNDLEPVIGKLYVSKAVYESLGSPAHLTVTLTPSA